MSDTSESLKKILELIHERNAAAANAVAAAKPFFDLANALAQQIEALTKPMVKLKDEGAVSLDVLGAATVTFKREATRTVDTPAVHEKWAEIPEAVQNVFKFKAGIDLKALRALGEEHAVVAAQFYTTDIAPAKMSIAMKAADK